MARQTITGIWANAATSDKIVAPTTTKLNNGWVAEKPSFRIFNWFWQKITNMIQNAEKYGIMEWSAETLYPLYGLTLDPATGIVYKSKQANNLNHAVTDTNWWQKLVMENPAYLHVRDEKTSGNAGGTFNAGAWQTRTLNTVKTNTIVGASLTSNQITLPAGTYRINASAPVWAVGRHKAKIYNITSAADILIGTSESDEDVGVSTNSVVKGEFTLAGASVLELRHYCSFGQAGAGFGFLTGFGVVEVYSEVEIWKID